MCERDRTSSWNSHMSQTSGGRESRKCQLVRDLPAVVTSDSYTSVGARGFENPFCRLVYDCPSSGLIKYFRASFLSLAKRTRATLMGSAETHGGLLVHDCHELSLYFLMLGAARADANHTSSGAIAPKQANKTNSCTMPRFPDGERRATVVGAVGAEGLRLTPTAANSDSTKIRPR